MRSVHGEGSCLAWKKRGRPDGDVAAPARTGRGEAHGARCGRGVAQRARCGPRGRRALTRRRRRCDASTADAVPSAMDASRRAAALGFRPVDHDLRSRVAWSGNRTRDSRIDSPMLYRLSYPVGGVPDSNRRPAGACPLLYLTEPTPRRAAPSPVSGIRHGNAARTGWIANPRRWKRSGDAAHCRLSPTGNSCDRRGRRRSKWGPLRCAARVEAPQRTRMRRQRALGLGVGIGTGCFRAKRRMEWMSPRGDARADANAENEKPPDADPRAFAHLGDRGDRSP